MDLKDFMKNPGMNGDMGKISGDLEKVSGSLEKMWQAKLPAL